MNEYQRISYIESYCKQRISKRMSALVFLTSHGGFTVVSSSQFLSHAFPRLMHCRSIISSIRIERLAISDTNLKQVGEIHKYLVVGSPTQLQKIGCSSNWILSPRFAVKILKMFELPTPNQHQTERPWVILSEINKTTTPFF